MSKLVDTLGSARVPLFARQETQAAKPRAVGTDGARMLQRIRHLGPDEEKMFLSIIKKLRRNRQAASEVLGCMLQYCQVRHMYELCQFWDPTWFLTSFFLSRFQTFALPQLSNLARFDSRSCYSVRSPAHGIARHAQLVRRLCIALDLAQRGMAADRGNFIGAASGLGESPTCCLA
jgi:hypothetical protein